MCASFIFDTMQFIGIEKRIENLQNAIAIREKSINDNRFDAHLHDLLLRNDIDKRKLQQIMNVYEYNFKYNENRLSKPEFN